MFVRNSWYAVAWADEIGRRQLLARTVIDEPLALYRTLQGRVVAFEDRCPHRRMPLSKGRITEDDRLVCAYHGLTFDQDGTCVQVPGQASACDIHMRDIHLTNYPVEERWGVVWIWMGDPERANASEIFDCSGLEKPGMHQTRLYRHAKANYLLLNDNLADLLHVAYLHIPSGGGNEFMGSANMDIKVSGNTYHFVRQTLDIPSPATYGRLSNAKGNVDRWHVVDFIGPSFYRIDTGVAATGSGGPQSTLPSGNGRWTIAPHHMVTPETEKTTHYFQIIGHESAPSSDSWRLFNQVIDEDVWAIENQQRNIDLRPEAPTTAIGSDSAMLAMRKIVSQMLQAEGR